MLEALCSQISHKNLNNNSNFNVRSFMLTNFLQKSKLYAMENNSIVTLILIVCLFLIFFAYLFSKYRSLKKKTKREEEMERIRAKKKEEEERILKMEETYILIMGDIEDTTIEPEDIPEEMYTNLFFSQIIDGISHPAIDPIFKELLLEGDCRTITIRNFNLKESTRFLKSTFGSFEKDFKDVSLSAKEILIYFLKNNNKLSEKKLVSIKHETPRGKCN